MTKSYHVFTSAPLPFTRRNSPASWITASSRATSPVLAPDTLRRAVRRISLQYQNVIFGDDNEEEESGEWENTEEGHDPTLELPPSLPDTAPTRLDVTNVDSLSRDETYNSDLTGNETTLQSEGSSISRFPVFNFSINLLSPLSSLVQPSRSGTRTAKLTILLGVLEVDGPNYVTVKIGALAGSEVCLLKLIVGDEHGAICKLVAWRETAESWAGIEEGPSLKRGDIVLFRNVTVSSTSPRPHDQLDSEKAQLTASPNLQSSAQICYRTLPRSHEDRKLRPDLRLADSVPAVRKVREVVTWMECMAGIPTR